MGLLRRVLPETTHDHDPALDVFDGGCFVLSTDGQLAGHVATSLGWFVNPFNPFTRHDWIWLLVVWADGRREFPLEDYPPWSYVAELQRGEFEFGGITYRAARLPDGERQRAWTDLAISEGDF